MCEAFSKAERGFGEAITGYACGRHEAQLIQTPLDRPPEPKRLSRATLAKSLLKIKVADVLVASDDAF